MIASDLIADAARTLVGGRAVARPGHGRWRAERLDEALALVRAALGDGWRSQ